MNDFHLAALFMVAAAVLFGIAGWKIFRAPESESRPGSMLVTFGLVIMALVWALGFYKIAQITSAISDIGKNFQESTQTTTPEPDWDGRLR